MIYAMEWLSPYTDPPAGQPRILAWGQCNGPDAEMEQEILKHEQPGYMFTIILNGPDPVLLSPERLARMRRTRKASEYRKKVPLFAEQLLEEDIKRRPNYYSVEGCRAHQESKALMMEHFNKEFEKRFSPEREIRV